ncbi:MAG: hypothetical protein GXZ15_01095 [Campylobacter sp.]|nr:hypothetical protein [Campylobacter sp.]
MINWMQKHKKKLVPAIWVSTIAFVGAGFVGWGAYNKGFDNSQIVAKVGKTKISVSELQQKYNNLYSYLDTITDGGMSQEQANAINLDQVALAEIIEETMKVNFAQELGIGATDKDVADYLLVSPEFQVDGFFNKDVYLNALKRVGIKPKDFENTLRKKIVIDKLNYSLNLPVTKVDLEAITSSYFIEDKISVEIIELNPDDINVTEDEVKEYWEANKEIFQTPIIYDVDALFISADGDASIKEIEKYWEDNKNLYINLDDTIKTFDEAKEEVSKDYKLNILKDDALKQYIALKKGEIDTNMELSISENNHTFPMNELTSVTAGEFVKPFEYDNGYIITKITKINPPRDMTYEEAAKIAKDIYKTVKAEKELDKLAKETLENFNGKDLGYVTRDSRIAYGGINESEFSVFLNELFNRSNIKDDYIKLENKIIVYKITEQKLVNNEKMQEYKDSLSQSAFAIKNTELTDNILQALQNRYKIKQLYKGGTDE